MNKHMLILPVLLVTATALLLFSQTLPPDGTVVVVDPTATPVPVGTPTPGSTPSPGATGKPTPRVTPTPSPSPSSTPLPSFGIAATTPDAVLREAQIQAGRVDPFKSAFAPDLPEFVPALEPEQLALPSLPPLPPDSSEPGTGPGPEPTPFRPEATPDPAPSIVIETPPPRPPLSQGLVLKGIMDGGVDPIAIIEVHGRTELVRVGERLSGGILVTSIHYEDRRVTLSRGGETATLRIPEPTTPSY